MRCFGKNYNISTIIITIIFTENHKKNALYAKTAQFSNNLNLILQFLKLILLFTNLILHNINLILLFI